jgi:DNA repair protein RecO (recombination protein O)
MRTPRVLTADCIVIGRKNLGEADRMITVFTRQFGKLRILARGVRKISSKRAPHIEIFARFVATVHRGKMDTLTEVSPIASFESVRSDLSRISAAYYLCELVDGLLPAEQPHEDVFFLLVKAFTALGSVATGRIDTLRARFAAALLTTLGYMAAGKKFNDNDIDGYVEQLLERKLKTVRLASRLNI